MLLLYFYIYLWQMCTCAAVCVWKSEEICGSRFFPSTLWVPVTKPRPEASLPAVSSCWPTALFLIVFYNTAQAWLEFEPILLPLECKDGRYVPPHVAITLFKKTLDCRKKGEQQEVFSYIHDSVAFYWIWRSGRVKTRGVDFLVSGGACIQWFAGCFPKEVGSWCH